ncbi:MAG: hypothetical protein HRU41_33105 [Saprospiraceae bacterium]|nr:hypothetical protein [Saprospiraceae bacterium]
MKPFKTLALTFTFLMFLGIGTGFSQSGWSTSRWYAKEGRSSVQTSYQKQWNAYYGRYVSVRYCRKLNWYREWHAGYIYYWRYDNYYGRYQWAREWKEGYFWYCTWSGWYQC